VVAYEDRKGDLLVTSDATEAYRLVLPAVQMVRRTMLFLKPDILVLLDRIRVNDSALPVQLRFQVDDDDGKGSVTASDNGFRITRPHAHLQASVYGSAGITVRTATLPLAAEHGVHPFAEVQAQESNEHILLTVCTAQESDKGHGTLTVQRSGSGFEISGRHNARSVKMRISTHQDIPEVVI
jgi:hypothetical protein